ncbi:MAG TPA: DNA sulfur modification protein DndB [Rhizomicrobium sp.]|nr:DNA sulfur modification protein DndB [Rhizomicrobium sp.]
MATVLPSLSDVTIPPNVHIEIASSMDALMTEIGRRSMMGFAGEVFFGTAFLQGSRLQFTTAMPMAKMIQVSKTDRSKKKDGIVDAIEHSNRPHEAGHAKQVRDYLASTACIGEKFILPSFTFNYGVGLDEESPDATLILFASAHDGANAWPGILCLAPTAKLDTTDGAHRRSQIEAIFNDPKVSQDFKDALKRNAVDVKIVFEASRSDSHQDFADCGKAKAIAKSLVTTFDVRDRRNNRSRELVKNVPFLAFYVDATASNVNLSAKSRKVWSMSAVRMFVSHIVDHHHDDEASVEEKTRAAETLFEALVRHLPQLRALEGARNVRDPEVTTGSLREKRGGDVALRGIGMAIFARAYLHCIEHDIDFDTVAAKLAKIDWNILDCEKDELPQGDEYQRGVRQHAKPLWAHLLVVGESKYRVSSSQADADAAWDKIKAQVLVEERRAA